MKQLTAIVIGAGNRGRGYTDIMSHMPEKFRVVGVAEPIEDRRNYVRNTHNIPEAQCFATWQEALAVPKFADIAIVSTQDRMHVAPALKALEQGYDLLLEKPVAPSAEECAQVLKKAQECGRKVMVCHVLRYAPFFMKLKKIIDDGVLGQVVSIDHTEAVGNLHQSHSYVRGNWGVEAESANMLLAKCCHDIDILQWLLGKNCRRIQSFGSLVYFREENAPAGAPARCMDGCPVADTCYYNAVKLYYDDKDNDWFRRAATELSDPTDADVWEALRTTKYGCCVFRCDNDVVDHQTVNMEFDGGVTVTMSMNAFNKGGRRIRVMGTEGELTAEMDAPADRAFEVFDFATRETRFLDVDIPVKGDSIVDGHGGGDEGVVNALYSYLTGELTADEVSEIGISVQNHLLVFAAEEARHSGTVVSIDEYVRCVMEKA